ncbi:histidine kinase dimerization/phospho-acceptor domain-containing protein [Gordonia hongkongensis]|uniref:histidine kinase n=1 Tax=Gordonia hongkongensis TaxID=1701090 RepID=A0AAX3T6Q3_9ACTN|nr:MULTISPECIES: ATP-binding protein [Gordonia]KSU56722.1 ATP-binding protein [Gordonia sp. SGD-V-85]QIK46255.1 HAMP domain-containing protein [Gordonia terrae]WFP24764.1 histidine kinase dimerization/phospho-acceptor domain-containing protein [Gordonia hongkongensis]
MTTRTTDDAKPNPAESAGVRQRPALSARWRITAWIMLTTFLLLVVVFVVTRNLLLRDVDTRVNNYVAQEASEFRTFAAEGVDPTTTEPFTSVSRLLEVFLSRQSAGEGEVMAGVVGDTEILELPGNAWPEPGEGRRVLDELRAQSGAAGVLMTAHGEIRWGKVDLEPAGGGSADPASEAAQPGTFIVGIYTDPGRELVDRTMRVLAMVGLGGMIVTTGVAYLVAGRILAPVRSVRMVAAEISENDLTARVPVIGRDDVAALAQTFNAMLDRIEDAYTTQRQFVDDAGHELRTPITVVRGHLELLPDDPEERRKTLDLVDSELGRMGRIVGDLLMLAKSEQPDFVAARPTDAAQLMLDIESKVQPLGDRQWLLMEVAEGPCTVDHERITQAMLQYASNAVRHTRAGSVIQLGSRFAGVGEQRHLSIWITDDGPGVEQQDAARIFERFQRGRSASAPQHAAGAGLGLAIVRAIADAHHGIAWVRSIPGHGATFGIDVPVPDTTPYTDAAPSVPAEGERR